MSRFAIVGCGGYVAPRHLQAIESIGGTLLAACDKNDSVGVLDKHFPVVPFFTDTERFDRHLSKLGPEGLDYLSVCTPNHLHDAHARLGLRLGSDVICEKPLVINPWNLDELQMLEERTGGTVYNVLQLRLLPELQALRDQVLQMTRRADVVLTYVTRRGPWYHASWKGDETKSGGLPTNIGIHFFDLLQWLFGRPERSELHVQSAARWAGHLELQRADVRWFLSCNGDDLPEGHDAPAYRSITINGEALEFSPGFVDLHTQVYQHIRAGGGYGIRDARPAVELAHRIRTGEVSRGAPRHPLTR